MLAGCITKSTNSGTAPGNSKATSVEKPPRKSTKEECMTGCVMLWEGNKANAAKPKAEMDKYCNSLCDAGQGMQNLDPTFCEKSEGTYRDTCYLEIAKKTNQSELCSKIVTESFAASCFSTIAKVTQDKTLCDKITLERVKKTCLEK